MADPITYTSTAEMDLDALAALLTEAYAGYEIPMHVDAGALVFMHDAFDLVPERSCVAWRAGHALGVAMLGVRGSRGWVGGMGVVPFARRTGVGEGLMRTLITQAREAGVRQLGLEVLERNSGAKALYEKLGFRALRRLELLAYDGAAPVPARTAEACDPRAARRRIVAARSAAEPWQRADETLDRLDVSTPALRAVTTPGGDAVYRVTEGRASVLQSHADVETTAGVLLDTILSRAGVRVLRYLNVPEDDVAAVALRARGAVRTATQIEMAMDLQPAQGG